MKPKAKSKKSAKAGESGVAPATPEDDGSVLTPVLGIRVTVSKLEALCARRLRVRPPRLPRSARFSLSLRAKSILSGATFWELTRPRPRRWCPSRRCRQATRRR